MTPPDDPRKLRDPAQKPSVGAPVTEPKEATPQPAARPATRPPSEPPPLAPPPEAPVPPGELEHLSAPSLFEEPSTLDTEPTFRLRRLDLSDLQEEAPTAPPVASALGEAAPPARPSRRRGVATPQETDWPEPPELPEPPVQFQPPEMTMPPRMPDLPPPQDLTAVEDLEEEETGLKEDGPEATRDISTGGAMGLARKLGTPELPEVTPSDLPNGLRQKLRASKPTQDLKPISRQPRRHEGDYPESTVVSQVVDVPVGAMVPEGSSTASDSAAGMDPVTSVWTAPAPGSEPPSAPAPKDSAGTGASRPVPSLARSDEKASPRTPPAEALAPRAAQAPPPHKIISRVPPAEGLIAGRYRVLERIGQGGMARIFRVRHQELGKDFALKIIHSALSDDTKVADMFYREARLASSLDHPNIVLLTDFGVDDQYGAFIVMEYLKGETLHARLRREGKLHPNVACEVTLQVAEALHFIHQRGVVHCDIKSENVFLCTPPSQQRRKIIVKLLDFGLSRENLPSGRVSLSEVGGTPAYMAPERINRLSPRPSMDIYSLGVLFYEMLTGSLPFTGTMEEVLVAQIKQRPEPPSQRLGEPLDDRLEELVLRALQKDPSKRQKDMGAFLYELRTVMDMLGIGRRRGRQAARAAATTGRVRNCELLVADCPVPLFMTDIQGTLVLANQSYASFVNLPLDKAAGTPLSETRLGRLCPEILEDLQRVLATRTPTQRILSFPWRSKKHVSMMVWLTPEILDRQVVGVIGVVHPFATQTP